MIYNIPLKDIPIKDVHNDDIIDMSSFIFDDTISDKKRAAMLYIRNTGLNAKFLFDNCSYLDKEDFLILYLTGHRLNVDIPILTSTWVKILVYNKFNTDLPSILKNTEIKIFYEAHMDLINEIYRFLISVPICSINLYDTSVGLLKKNIEISECDIFNSFTFMKLFDFDEIITLSCTIEGFDPVFYRNYFDPMYECRPGLINDLVNKFPYSALLNILLCNNPEIIEKFIEAVKDELNIN